jgi:hypothetical protein
VLAVGVDQQVQMGAEAATMRRCLQQVDLLQQFLLWTSALLLKKLPTLRSCYAHAPA